MDKDKIVLSNIDISATYGRGPVLPYVYFENGKMLSVGTWEIEKAKELYHKESVIHIGTASALLDIPSYVFKRILADIKAERDREFARFEEKPHE